MQFCSVKCGASQICIILVLCVSKNSVVCQNELIPSESAGLEKKIIEQFETLTHLQNISRACHTQLINVNDALKYSEMWAFKMLDAWAKLPSGILYGHTTEMGNFDECLDITTPLFGKYCMASVPFVSSVNDMNVQIQMGICTPNHCTTDDLNVILKSVLSNMFNINLNATNNLVSASTCTTNKPVELEARDWVAVSIFFLLVLCMALSTAYGYICTRKEKLPKKLLISFSIIKNFQQLMKIQHGHIPCLHGIRCFSLFWIIYIHCNLYQILSPNINAAELDRWQRTLFSMVDQSGAIAVDTFFFLSGLLMIMGALREMDKNMGKLNVPMLYIHRYLRLTPILAITVLFYMTLMNYIGNGPLWKTFTAANKFCDDSWWATLLYVQNYVAPGKLCLGHAWYLAVDTQLFVLSPIFIILIWKWRKVGIAVTAIVGVLLVGCLFSIIMVHGYTIYDVTRTYGAATEAMPKIYYSTHTRCSPWIVGLLFGHYLHRNNGHIAKIPKWTVAIGWLISLIIFVTLVFAWYPRSLPHIDNPTVIESAFYLAVGRVAWPLALCWTVYACMNGYGGIINKLLSWTFWQPISKLSYIMYLWHLIVITINTARLRTNTYFSDYDVILNYWSNFGITLLVSVCIYLAVEAPFTDIETQLLPRMRLKVDKQPSATSAPTSAMTISQQNLCD